MREAVQISKAIKKPVKVVWTREDDMRGGFYRPRAFHSISAGLGADGNPVAWQHRIVCQSFIVGTPFEGEDKLPFTSDRDGSPWTYRGTPRQ